jgi:hypothetical protein
LCSFPLLLLFISQLLHFSSSCLLSLLRGVSHSTSVPLLFLIFFSL